MNNENINSKLTPSAKEALHDLTENYRKSLIDKAYSIAARRNTADREISLRDILEAEQLSQKWKERQKYAEYKRRRWIMLISFSGTIYAIAGLLIYLLQNKKFSIETDLGLIIAVIGILLTLLAFFYWQLLAKKQYVRVTSYTNASIPMDSYDIVKRWQIIEQLTISIMNENNISSSKSNSINQVIKYLTDNFTNSEADFMKIKSLLQIRNRILHEGYNLSESEKREYVEVADDIIEKLERARKELANS